MLSHISRHNLVDNAHVKRQRRLLCRTNSKPLLLSFWCRLLLLSAVPASRSLCLPNSTESRTGGRVRISRPVCVCACQIDCNVQLETWFFLLLLHGELLWVSYSFLGPIWNCPCKDIICGILCHMESSKSLPWPYQWFLENEYSCN